MNLTVLLVCSLAGAAPVGGEPVDPPPPAAAAGESLTLGAVVPVGVSAVALILAIGALLHSQQLAGRVRLLEAAARSFRSARAEPQRDELSRGAERARVEEPVRAPLPPRREVVADPVQARAPSPEVAAPAPRQETRRDPTGFNRASFGRPAAPAGVAPLPERREPQREPPTAPEASPADAWLRVLSAGPHGSLGVAIGGLYLASGELAAMYRDAGSQQEFVRIAQVGLKARMARFGDAQRSPVGDFQRDWVEPDLIPILDGLSDLYSRAISEVREGNTSASAIVRRLHELLYHQVAAECEEAGWFRLLVIVPFETDFDPIRHAAIGSAQAPGARDKVVDIRQVGRLDVVSGTVLAPAHVVVGR